MMHTITCESADCGAVIAVADTYEEAVEVAKYEKEASDNDGEVWECKSCLDKRYAEGMAEARIYERQQRTRRFIHEEEERREDFLQRADLAFDSAKDRGEI